MNKHSTAKQHSPSTAPTDTQGKTLIADATAAANTPRTLIADAKAAASTPRTLIADATAGAGTRGTPTAAAATRTLIADATPQAPPPPGRGTHRKRKQGMGAAAATRHACAFLLNSFMSEGLQVSHVYLNEREQLINENCEYTYSTDPTPDWKDPPRDLRARLGERGGEGGGDEEKEQAAAAKRRKIDVPKSTIGDRMKKADGDMRKLWGAPDDNG